MPKHPYTALGSESHLAMEQKLVSSLKGLRVEGLLYNKTAAANVIPIRQRTQYSCMAASMLMSLKANDYPCAGGEDEVNKVMGAAPMRGAAWEQALATAQHYGCRATLTSPSTLGQVKEWTDRGVPVMIAWNPEGREWSHASVVFDVREDPEHGLMVYVADPNIPDPEERVRIVPKKEFYGKWYEKWPNYMVRRPAMAIEREITPEGRQVMAKQASSEWRKHGPTAMRDIVDSNGALLGSMFIDRGKASWRPNQLVENFVRPQVIFNKGPDTLVEDLCSDADAWIRRQVMASSKVGSFDWKVLGASLREAFASTRVPAKRVTGEELPDGSVTIDLQFGFDYAERPGWDDDKASALIHKVALKHGLKAVGFPGEKYLTPDGKTLIIGVMASSSGGAQDRLAGVPSVEGVLASLKESKDIVLKLKPEYGNSEYGSDFVTKIMRHPGNGAHQTRTKDVEDGRSRKPKFKKNYRDMEAALLEEYRMAKDLTFKIEPTYGGKAYGPEFVTEIMRHPGNGAHQTRTVDVEKGRSRKEKFKKNYRDMEASSAVQEMAARVSSQFKGASDTLSLQGASRAEYLDAVWGMYEKTYRTIGMHISSPTGLLKYDRWDIGMSEGVPVNFALFEKEPFGWKSGLSGSDGSPAGKSQAIQVLRTKFKIPGIYGEVSHKVKDIVLAAGAPIVCANLVGEVLGKHVQPLEDGISYSRTLTGFGLVTKVMVGHPRGIPTTSGSNPSCPVPQGVHMAALEIEDADIMSLNAHLASLTEE